MKGYLQKIEFCLYRVKSEILLLTLIFCFLVHAIISVSTSQAKQQTGKPELVPASLLKWPEGSSKYVILVDKSAQKIFVYQRNDLFNPVKVYRCSTGENNGPKSRKNDRKTPEGLYFFTNSYVKKDLSPIYGVRAFPIDYPNPMDGKEGKGGYGIWFHGTNKPLKPNDTNGCIVLEDRSIDDLASYIKINDTPVIISSKIEMIRPEKLQKNRIELEKIIEDWKNAWEKKEIEIKKKDLEIKKKKLDLELKEQEIEEMAIEEKEKTLKIKEELIEKESELSQAEIELKQKIIKEKEQKIIETEIKRAVEEFMVLDEKE